MAKHHARLVGVYFLVAVTSFAITSSAGWGGWSSAQGGGGGGGEDLAATLAIGADANSVAITGLTSLDGAGALTFGGTTATSTTIGRAAFGVNIPGHILAAEAAAPGTPASGKVALYAATNGRLYSKDDTGLVSLVSGGGSAITNGTAITSTDTADAGERVVYDPTGGTFTISAPASPVMGTRWAVKNRSASAVAVTISGNGSSIESPTASYAALAATFLLAGDGISVEWEFDGTQWLVV